MEGKADAIAKDLCGGGDVLSGGSEVHPLVRLWGLKVVLIWDLEIFTDFVKRFRGDFRRGVGMAVGFIRRVNLAVLDFRSVSGGGGGVGRVSRDRGSVSGSH
jgi:hypothetical protein